MQEEIGNTAGRIWEVLGKKGRVNMSQLSKHIKAESAVVYQALGWLAREGKIKYDNKFVSLSDSELESFKRNIH